jgi:hypothetical protein
MHIYCCFSEKKKKNKFFCLNGPPASFLGPPPEPVKGLDG